MLTPGELVLHRFRRKGFSTRDIARLVGRDHSRIVRLARPLPEGTGGSIPPKLHLPLLEAAQQCGVKLYPKELVMGGRG